MTPRTLGCFALLLSLQATAFAQETAFPFDASASHNDAGKFAGLQKTIRTDHLEASVLGLTKAPTLDPTIIGLRRNSTSGKPSHYYVHSKGYWWRWETANPRGVNRSPGAIQPAQEAVDHFKDYIWEEIGKDLTGILTAEQKVLKVIGTTPDYPPTLPIEFERDARSGLLVPHTFTGSAAGGLRVATSQHDEGLYLWFDKLPAVPGDDHYKPWLGTWVVIEVPPGLKHLPVRTSVATAQDHRDRTTADSGEGSEQAPNLGLEDVINQVSNGLPAEIAQHSRMTPLSKSFDDAKKKQYGDFLKGALANETDFNSTFDVPSGINPQFMASLREAAANGWEPQLVASTKGWKPRAEGGNEYVLSGGTSGTESGLAPGVYIYLKGNSKNRGYMFELPPGMTAN